MNTLFQAGARVQQIFDLSVLAELREAPELLTTLDGIATRTESVVGPFPHARP